MALTRRKGEPAGSDSAACAARVRPGLELAARRSGESAAAGNFCPAGIAPGETRTPTS